MTWILRAIAVLIAVAGLIDPAFTMTGRVRARIAVVVQDTATMTLPAADGLTRREVAERVRARLAKDLGGDYDIEPRLTSDAAAAIVIGDSYPPSASSPFAQPPTPSVLPSPSASTSPATPVLPVGPPSASVSPSPGFSRTNVPVATVTVGGDVSPNVQLLRVDAPRDVPVGTAIRVGVDVEGTGVSGQTSTLVARVSGLEVGRASHVWRGDRDRWHADIDAVPVGEPPFVVRVEAQPLDEEKTALDNAADALVDLRRAPLRVQIYEPRPSWATTFIRRALEGDARFDVTGVTATSKSIATRSGDSAALTSAALDGFDVLVVGGLERLTAAEAHALERFMREREGAVVAVPDAKPTTAPALDLLRGVTFTERLSERPETLASVAPLAAIQASELLLVSGEPPLTDRLASTSGANASPVVVSMPHGSGRLVVSGALDAWRFRTEDDNAFDRFWQSTIAGLALAAPPAIEVSVTPPVVKPGQLAEVFVRVRETAPMKTTHDASASPRGGSSGSPFARSVRATVDGRPVRLWPGAEAGVFLGSFVARDTDGRSTVVAEVDEPAIRRSLDRAIADVVSAARPLVVSKDARALLPRTTAPLSLLSASHHGIDATPDNVGEVERFIRRTVASPPAPMTRRPMRSAWWMLPFAACLSGEWYLRRRRGAR